MGLEMAGASAWTDDHVEKMKTLWESGASCSQIAGELGPDFTRNSVIGKMHRLNLSGRDKKVHTAPKLQRDRNRFVPRSGNVTPQRSYAKAAPRPPHPAPHVPDVLEEMRALTLMELTQSNCRWPLGDPRDEWFRFCGNDKDMDHSYCPFHKRLSVSPSNNAERNARARQRRAEAVA